ncbi:MAG: aminoacyl-tRNA hydrolase [Candidatus Omnitrophica bacterium]|nr:aminoacyl-tRNA hydrolase [Candidatus Omnitrophota bacterium]MDD5352870.1 aminoacyl-tRNA hydrolase [Candidatus Omnitrophota bacterium]MDD5550469.1 aminoacyl-tRNA hydrolase [Candidatus Omnitrophota bacterium]
MKLIVGLGNPGLSYENTRHNLGAKSVKSIAKIYKVKLKLDRSLKSRLAHIDILNNECLLAMPNTYMNFSGEAVSLLLRAKKINPADLLVVHDDVDLDLGEMRFKKKGSSGGHKGIASIIKALNSQDFNRLKLGIGRSSRRQETKDHVLSSFSKQEAKIIMSLLKKIASACEVWVEFGIDRAMNEFN